MKKANRTKNLRYTKASLIGVKKQCWSHFCKTFSLFSKEISENFFTYGHSLPRQWLPQIISVPILVDRIFSKALTNILASKNPLFVTSSATYKNKITSIKEKSDKKYTVSYF